MVWIRNESALDCNKFERDTRTTLKMVRIDTINSKENVQIKNSMRQTVKDVIKNDAPDLIILEGGTTEITQIDTKSVSHNKTDAMKQKRGWENKVESESNAIFEIAKEATTIVEGLQVVIIKRPPRYDTNMSDPYHTKSNLSHFANCIYDQLWYKKGSPSNIHVVNVELGTETSENLKNLIYGKTTSQGYDGVMLRGEGASRHFSYRSIQAIKPIIQQSHLSEGFSYPKKTVRISENIPGYRTHGSASVYSIPVKNRFQGNF